MPHIDLGNELPGMVGLLAYRPETAGPLAQLADVLLAGDSTLSRGERELIAAWCHGATSASSVPRRTALPRPRSCRAGSSRSSRSWPERRRRAVSPKLRALLEIASLVRVDGRLVCS